MRAFALAFFTVVAPTHPAAAHEAIVGGGPFVNGILHPFIEPTHILLLLALGLWIGQQDRHAIRRAIVAFSVALIAGLIAAGLATLPPLILQACALIAGLLAASAWRAETRVAAMIALAAAFVVGFDSPGGNWAGAAGTWVGAELIVLYLTALLMRTQAAWLRAAARIVGAWIAAIALLLLALNLKG